MIEVDLTDLYAEAKEYIDMITENKSKKIREEMIKFLKEAHFPDSFEYAAVLEFIDDFFVEVPLQWDDE